MLHLIRNTVDSVRQYTHMSSQLCAFLSQTTVTKASDIFCLSSLSYLFIFYPIKASCLSAHFVVLQNETLHFMKCYNTKICITWVLFFSHLLLGEGNVNPCQYSCLKNPLDRGAWWATVHGVPQSWTRLKRLRMHVYIGEGNGNPLQYSFLETLRDRGAWWAAVYGGRTELDMTEVT